MRNTGKPANDGGQLGQAKLKQRAAFARELVEAWESEDCVNFAVALARVTGWLLHVDWWVPSSDPDITIEQFRPLRVYVADNGNQILDVRGIREIETFSKKTILPLVLSRGIVDVGGVRTRFYDESALTSLPLRSKPESTKIECAVNAIEANTAFLASIPKRLLPCIPAYAAAQYSFGQCAIFAEALREITGLTPVALIAIQFKLGWKNAEGGDDGYVHSFVVHPDGMGEDSWGKASVTAIAERFGIVDFRLNSEVHGHIVGNLRRNSSDLYEQSFAKAKELIKIYRH